MRARRRALGGVIADTERLRLRPLQLDDAGFILELVNEPSWIRFIGDKHVASTDDACRYLADGPLAMYDRYGFGLWLVGLKRTNAPMGICGLIKRDSLDDVDLGFAFLSRYRGNGYAFEAAAAVLAYGREVVGLTRIVAILSRDNDRSKRLLEKLGFEFERTIVMSQDIEELALYARTP